MRPIIDGEHDARTRMAEGPPTDKPTTSSRLITMLIGLIGDAEKVRYCIDCSPVEFTQCRAGVRELDTRQLGLVIDYIVKEQRLLIAKHREVTAIVREKSRMLRGTGK